MKKLRLTRLGLLISTVLCAFSITIVPANAHTSTRTPGASDDQAKLKLIITRGDNEINRRLTALNTLNTKISEASKLSATNKAILSSEVSNEINGLMSLKTKLDADTDVATARADAQSIVSGYRVYALLMPKVFLIKTADDQQVAEDKLLTLADKLQGRITTAKDAGKNVDGLQRQLTSMRGNVNAAKAISNSIETSIINLQPSDYNSDHSILKGDRNKLKTAQGYIKAATGNARNIIAGLKSL